MIKKVLVQNPGETWARLGTAPVRAVYHVRQLPSGRLVKFGAVSTNAAIPTHVWYSDDEGNTWQQVTNVVISQLADLKFSAPPVILPNGRLFIASDSRLFYTNNGKDFTVTTLASNISRVIGFGLPFDPSNPLHGRRLFGVSSGNSLRYTDTNYSSWNTVTPLINEVSQMCITSTGRLFIVGRGYVKYSDDNGDTWTDAFITSDNYRYIHITHTGRIIISSVYEAGSTGVSGSARSVMYSDDNGDTWTTLGLSLTLSEFVNLPSGRILANQPISGPDRVLWYSDDNGSTWVKVQQIINYILQCVTSSGRLIASHFYWAQPSDSNITEDNIWYSDPEYKSVYASKPLTGKQAKELVQQCKAYVQALKDGN